MKIVEIKALNNGAHRNQTGIFNTIPEGWAVIPGDMETKNFPFGEITANEVDGIMTVTKWVAGTIPEVKENRTITELEQLRADVDYIAVMTEVEL